MSAVSAERSSSSLSMRSTNDLRCSFAKPLFATPTPYFLCLSKTIRARNWPTQSNAWILFVSLLGALECRLLLRRRFFLIFRLPLGRRHSVHDRARLV